METTYTLIQIVPAPANSKILFKVSELSATREEHDLHYIGLWQQVDYAGEEKVSEISFTAPVWPTITSEGENAFPATINDDYLGVIIDGESIKPEEY